MSYNFPVPEIAVTFPTAGHSIGEPVFGAKILSPPNAREAVHAV